MSPPPATELSDRQREVLQQGGAGLLITVGEDRFPTTSFVWSVAVSAETVRFATEGSATVANLERDNQASLQIIGDQNQVFLIKGTTRILKPRLEALPFASALMSLHVTEVKDQTWPEVYVSPLAYEWTSDRREEWRAIEQAVYREMRQWEP
jgi:Pyridoxamine 5'-phosphate oxidase